MNGEVDWKMNVGDVVGLIVCIIILGVIIWHFLPVHDLLDFIGGS